MDYKFIRKQYRKLNWIILIALIFLITGCDTTETYAPVVNGWRQPSAGHNFYIVKTGDTLYSIAWAFGWDYRRLAEVNHLSSPYKLHAGQRIRFVKIRPRVKRKRKHTTKRVKLWVWPARGRVIRGFSLKSGGNKGIDIRGRLGEKIRASSTGLVVYSGLGLRAYGKLIIIKHTADFLSAYAHNRQILVREGQKVKAGQVIATMGRNSGGQVLLHFEIRKRGKPINPLRFFRKKR